MNLWDRAATSAEVLVDIFRTGMRLARKTSPEDFRKALREAAREGLADVAEVDPIVAYTAIFETTTPTPNRWIVLVAQLLRAHIAIERLRVNPTGLPEPVSCFMVTNRVGTRIVCEHKLAEMAMGRPKFFRWMREAVPGDFLELQDPESQTPVVFVALSGNQWNDGEELIRRQPCPVTVVEMPKAAKGVLS